jgi:hypothetical protein
MSGWIVAALLGGFIVGVSLGATTIGDMKDAWVESGLMSNDGKVYTVKLLEPAR